MNKNALILASGIFMALTLMLSVIGLIIAVTNTNNIYKSATNFDHEISKIEQNVMKLKGSSKSQTAIKKLSNFDDGLQEKVAFAVAPWRENKNSSRILKISTALTPFKFSVVYLNVGEGYNKTTGIFTVPLSGVYFLQLEFVSNHNTSAALSIIIHDNPKCRALADHYGYQTATCSAFVDLKVGEEVYVGITGSSKLQTNHIVSGYGSFCGFKI